MENKENQLPQNQTESQLEEKELQAQDSVLGDIKTKKKIPQPFIYLLLALFFMIVGASGLWFYQNRINKPSLVQPPANQIPTNSIIPSPATTQPPQIKTTYETVTKANPQDESKTDVYIKNLDTSEETFLMTLTNVYRQHVHNSEYHNDSLYIIKRIGYDGYPDEEWSDELWKYNSNNKNGSKLFSSQGLSFLVAPDESKIAIRADEKVYFINVEGKQLRQYSPGELDSNLTDMANGLGISEWSADSQTLWGSFNFGPVPATFYEIDTSSWQVNKYDVSSLNFGTEMDLNTEARQIVYSNYPALFDVDSARDFESSGKKIVLYLYDFVNQENREIATSIVKRFNPKWLDNNEIEYDNPEGDDRLVYSP